MTTPRVGSRNPLPPGGVPIRFTGRGWDYFRIWVGDMLCMALTLGLYWPWLRRRRWQFLNANTWVGEVPLGDARLITALGSWPRIWQQLLLAVALFVLWRWTHNYGLLGWPLMVLCFSLSGPWWLLTGWRGRIGQLYWQGGQIRFDGSWWGACRTWALMGLSLLPMALMAGAFVLDSGGAGIAGLSWFSVGDALSESVRTLLFWCVALSIVLALSGWFYHALRYGLRHIVHPVYAFRSGLRFLPLLRAAAVAVLLVLPVPFLVIGLLYANWPLLLATLSIEPPGTLQTLVSLAPAADTLLGGLRMDGASTQDLDICVACRAAVVVALTGLASLIVLMGWRYFMARVWNQAWRTLSLPGGVVESHLPAGRLMATGFFCDVLTVLSCGLYHPFAVVRMERLKRESLRMMPVYAVDGGLPAGEAAPGLAAGLPAAPAIPRPRLHWAVALVMMAVPATLLVLVGLYGKPLVGNALAQVMPATLSQSIGEGALAVLRQQGLQPSRLDAATQAHWRSQLEEGIQAVPALERTDYRIEFVQGGDLLGANALALPSGIVLISDELLALAEAEPAEARVVMLGVLARELVHLRWHHAERSLLLSAMRPSLWAMLTGQGRERIAEMGAQTVLQQGYSQQDERLADEAAIVVMRGHGSSPEALVRLLQRLQQGAQADPKRAVAAQRVPIGMASQVLDARRLQRFREAGDRRGD